MKVLIVAATELEVVSENIRNFPVLITGVGMVNTAINLTKELIKSDYDLVINMGIAGSFSDDVKIGDVVEVVEDTFSEIGFEDGDKFSEFTDFKIKTTYSVKSKTNLRKAKGVTINTVHGKEDSITEIVNRINSDIETMEGASVFKVCEELDVSYMQIRAISNNVEIRNKDNWDINLAIRNLNSEVEKIIDTL
tara:strand:- start:481 stop:1059 length:579 start_codon:yes stop_codon:yes gene_type:complete